MGEVVAINKPTVNEKVRWQEIKDRLQPDSEGRHDALLPYDEIQKAIQTRRDDFIAEYQAGKYGSEFQTYEDEIDRAVYKTLGQFRARNQEAFQRAKQELDAETTFQLETAIGERLGVGLSTYGFGIENGKLINEITRRPIIEMIDRGRQTRNAQVDQMEVEMKIPGDLSESIKQRHDAEVTQFEKIEKEFTEPDDNGNLPPIGKTIISISPPGPGYAHNFYDVFVLRENTDGTRYIEAKRYASALSAEDSLKQIQKIKPGYGKNWEDASLIPNFLQEPVVIDDPLHMLFNNPDGIHAHIQSDENAMTEADFALVKDAIAGIISVYLNEVFEDYNNADRHAEILDAMKNKADDEAKKIRQRYNQRISNSQRRDNVVIIDHRNNLANAHTAALAEIRHFGAMEVRTVTTGCGESGSSRKKRNGLGSLSQVSLGDVLPGNMSSFSLLDDILDEEQKWFICPKCNYHADGPVGNQCPGCGLKKEDYDGEKCA